MESVGSGAGRTRSRGRRRRARRGADLPAHVSPRVRERRRRSSRRLRRGRARVVRGRAGRRLLENPAVLQRTVWLAGITLAVAIAALALARRDAGGGHDLPGAVPVRGTSSGYYTSRAAPYGPTPGQPRTACGVAFNAKTQGIAHPVLPCGVKGYVRFHGTEG